MQFLTKKEAYNYILESEKHEPVLFSINKSLYPYQFRCPSNYTIYKILEESLDTFTLEEQRKYIEEMNKADKYLSKLFPKTPWILIKAKKNYQFGFPHTINQAIIIPQPVDYTTLIHEKIHILQRNYSNYFRRLYINKYGFIPIERMKIKDDYFVVNPDGFSVAWGFPINKGKHILIPYCRLSTQSGYPVSYCLIYNTESNNITYQGPIDNPEYKQHFRTIDQTYHPNEISAIDITNYLIHGDYLFNLKQ